MGMLKRLIARIFNIKVEDLPQQPSPAPASPRIDSALQQEIAIQIKAQLQSAIEETILPEIRKTLTEKQSQPQAPDLSIKDQPVQTEVIKPTVPRFEDFPVIDEEQPLVAAENPVDVEGDLLEVVSPEGQSVIGEDQLEVSQTEIVYNTNEEILPLEEPLAPRVPEVEPITLAPVKKGMIRVGIDFGTTTTAVSIKLDDENRPEVLPIGLNGSTRFFPSIVFFQPGSGSLEQRALIGEPADSYDNPEQVIRSVKRCLGCPGESCRPNTVSHGETDKYPFPWCLGDGLVHISDTEAIEPAQIAKMIIKEALTRAIKAVRDDKKIDLTEENVCFSPINLGCGAKFDLERRELLLTIAQEMGFQHATIDNIVEEPILAGYAFSRYADQPEGRALIYDFGGGTFDVAILDVDRIQDKLRVTVVATTGENWLGGDDIDRLVYQYFISQIAEKTSSALSDIEEKLGEIEISKLKLLARICKEQLSVQEQFIDVHLSHILGSITLSMTRHQFEDLFERSGMLKKSLKAAERACKLAHAFKIGQAGKLLDANAITKHKLKEAAASIDRVVLVGGVTKIPMIRKKLTSIFGDAKIVKETVVEPISAVAVGAGYELDPQHYSICVPPYGIYMKYQVGNRKKINIITIFEPFEYLDYHKRWVTNFSAVYFKDINLLFDASDVTIYSQKAGEQHFAWEIRLGSLSVGQWRFEISMDGQIYYHKLHDTPRSLPEYPIIHPVQQSIRDAQKRRIEEEEARRRDNEGGRDDWIRRMMNEN